MDLFENPMGTDGFEFVEYTAPDTEALGRLFESMGFTAVARHRSKRVTLYKQGGINFIVNAEPDASRNRSPAFTVLCLRIRHPRERCCGCIQACRTRCASVTARLVRWSWNFRRSRASAGRCCI